MNNTIDSGPQINIWTREEELRLLNGVWHILRLTDSEEMTKRCWEMLQEASFPDRTARECEDHYGEELSKRFSILVLKARKKDLKLSNLIGSMQWSARKDKVLLNAMHKNHTWEKVAIFCNSKPPFENDKVTEGELQERYFDFWEFFVPLEDLRRVSGQWRVKGEIVLREPGRENDMDHKTGIFLKTTGWTYNDIAILLNQARLFENWSKVAKKMHNRHSVEECQQFYENNIKFYEENILSKMSELSSSSPNGKWIVIPRIEFVERNDLEISNKRKHVPEAAEVQLVKKRQCIGKVGELWTNISKEKESEKEKEKGAPPAESSNGCEKEQRSEVDTEDEAEYSDYSGDSVSSSEDIMPESLKVKTRPAKSRTAKKVPKTWTPSEVKTLLKGYRQLKKVSDPTITQKSLFEQISKIFFSNNEITRTGQACLQYFNGHWQDIMELLDNAKEFEATQAIKVCVNRNEGKIVFYKISGAPYQVEFELTGPSKPSWTREEDHSLLEGLRNKKGSLPKLLKHRHKQVDCQDRSMFWKKQINWKDFKKSKGSILVSEGAADKRTVTYT